MSVYQTSVLETHTSGLRYGLIDVEPFEEQRIVKKFGLKFREHRMGLRPAESFHDFLKFNTESVIQNISLPDRLDKTALSKMIAEKRIQSFDSDVEFKKALKGIEKSKQGYGLKRGIEFFVNRQRSNMDDIFEAYSGLFLVSDLPLSFISDLTDFEVTYMAALEAIRVVVNRAATWMGLAKSNFKRYQKAFGHMKMALSPLVDQIESAVYRGQALKWFLILSNADRTETALEPKRIESSKMDKGELERLRWEFIQESTKLRKMIMQRDKDNVMFAPLVEESELKKSFAEVVMVMTG